MSDSKITESFVKALPKTDLHVHLDGSIRPGTLIDLSKEFGVTLQSWRWSAGAVFRTGMLIGANIAGVCVGVRLAKRTR